jgi:hypothetical protein
MPQLSVDQGIDLAQSTPEGEPFQLNVDFGEIRRFEEKYRNTFFDDINLQPDDPDIRAVWEPARLQHAALLLLRSDKDESARISGRGIVLRWILANPFLRGPHFMSAMECGLRVPVFFYCLKAAPEISNQHRSVLLSAIYEHTWWIEHNLSLYASLGNHTVCESVGLAFAGAVFRNHDEGRRWLETGCRLLDQELTHQVLSDGGPAEQAHSYHRFVLDLFWLAADFLEKNNLYNCSRWKDRLERGELFLAAFKDASGASPSIGDNDDGHAIAPGVAPIREIASTSPGAIATFPKSGYTAVRSPNGLILTFDHGPIGMAPLYNHGHADALAVTLSFKGKPILVDPGTYRYNGVPDWRKYFKGTRAHNTITVDRQDQAVQETGFIWSRPYKSTLLNRTSGNGWVLLHGSHDGYARLRDSVIHERTVFVEDGVKILIQDRFRGQDYHDFELNFHLHPDAEIQNEDRFVTIDMGGVRAFIRLVEGGSFVVVRGREDPIHGWYSPIYGVRVPTPVLSSWARKPAGEVLFVTVVSLGGPCDADELRNGFNQIEQQTAHS